MPATFNVTATRNGRASKLLYLQLAGAVAFWAGNWTLMKSILPSMAPLTFTAYSLAGAVVAMAVVSCLLRMPLLPAPGERLRLALIGPLQMAAMLGLSTIALQFVGAGRAAVLTYTMQLWALPIGWIIARDRVTPRAFWGGVIGFVGILSFLNPSLVNWHDNHALLGNGLLVLSAISWATGACLFRRYIWKTPFWTQTLWQLLWSTVVITVPALLLESRRPVIWTLRLLAVLAYNWFFAKPLCFWWWGKALAAMPASRVGQIVSFVPVAALFISAASGSNERLTATTFASIIVMGIGVGLSLKARGKSLPLESAATPGSSCIILDVEAEGSRRATEPGL